MRRDHPLLSGLAALVARPFQLGGHSLALAATSDHAAYPKCSVPEYGQCGGIGYSGKKCCEFFRMSPLSSVGERSCLSDVQLNPVLVLAGPPGWACHRTNEWYSRCRKKLDANGCTNAEWAQCGGRDYEGETCCAHLPFCTELTIRTPLCGG